LPPEYKVALGERKRILREVAKQYLPAAVLDRKDKKVFVSKIDWFPLRHHASALRDMANSRTMQQLPWIRPRRMADYVERYLKGDHNDILGVWRLYTAWRWLETTPFGRARAGMGC
jgi:asparagine synthetase B (glutamine-hydrolysing)